MKAPLVLASLSLLVTTAACKTPGSDATNAKTADAGGAGAGVIDAAASMTDGGPADSIGIPLDELTKTLNPENLPTYSGPTGSIQGTIWIDGEPSPPRRGKLPSQANCPDSAALYNKEFREGPANDKGERPLADAAVGVIDPPPNSTFFVPQRMRAETLVLKTCTPEKRTIAMTFGQSLDVANRSGKITAPQLQPSPGGALMIAPNGGDAVHLYPPKPGHYKLVDMMSTTALDEDLYVFLFALHDVSDERGHYKVTGVPAGKRRVFAHLPATDDEAFVDVDVPADGIATADVVIHQKPKPAPVPVDAGATRPPVVH